MADTFYYSRDTLVHLTDSAGAIYKIPVLDGFSFSQATNVTEVSLNEMATAAGVSRRARQMFTDSTLLQNGHFKPTSDLSNLVEQDQVVSIQQCIIIWSKSLYGML